jgi:hypothetical protein
MPSPYVAVTQRQSRAALFRLLDGGWESDSDLIFHDRPSQSRIGGLPAGAAAN